MRVNTENIFIPDGCLSEVAMFRYLENDLPKPELDAVEKHLAECEMCSDAVEGYRFLSGKEQASQIIAMVKEEIASNPNLFSVKKKNSNNFKFLAYAATLVLICGTVAILYQNLKNQQHPDISKINNEQQLLINKDKENLAEQKKVKQQQADTLNGLIAFREKNVQEESGATGAVPKSGGNNEFLPDGKADENKEIDKINITDQRNAPGNIADGEVVYKTPLIVDDTKSRKDSNMDLDSKREGKPSDIVVAGQVSEVQLESVVVTASKSEKKSKGKTANHKTPSTVNKNDAPVRVAGDEVSSSDNQKEEIVLLEKHSEILKKNPADYSSLYYSGLSYFNLKKYKKCIRQLDKVIKVENAEFYDDAVWYKALSLIALNKKEEAVKMLDSIISGGKKYAKQAEVKKSEFK